MVRCINQEFPLAMTSPSNQKIKKSRDYFPKLKITGKIIYSILEMLIRITLANSKNI